MDFMWDQLLRSVEERSPDTANVFQGQEGTSTSTTRTLRQELPQLNLESNLDQESASAKDLPKSQQIKAKRKELVDTFLTKKKTLQQEIQAIRTLKLEDLATILQKCHQIAQLKTELVPIVTEGVLDTERVIEIYRQKHKQSKQELKQIENLKTEKARREDQKKLVQEDLTHYKKDIEDGGFFADLVRYRQDEIKNIDDQINTLQKQINDNENKTEEIQKRMQEYTTKIEDVKQLKKCFEKALSDSQEIIDITIKNITQHDASWLLQQRESLPYLQADIDQVSRSPELSSNQEALPKLTLKTTTFDLNDLLDYDLTGFLQQFARRLIPFG